MESDIAFAAVTALDAFTPDLGDVNDDIFAGVLDDSDGAGPASAGAAQSEGVPDLPGPFSTQPKRKSEGELEFRERKRSCGSAGFEMRGGENKVRLVGWWVGGWVDGAVVVVVVAMAVGGCGSWWWVGGRGWSYGNGSQGGGCPDVSLGRSCVKCPQPRRDICSQRWPCVHRVDID
jgi:hypothetical protein